MKKTSTILHRMRAVVMIVISLIASEYLLSSCSQEDLEIQQNFPFEVLLMPIPTEVSVGQKVELRFKIESGGNFTGTKYYLRYFQFEGTGDLQYFSQDPYLMNDSYELPQKEFRLYFTPISDKSHAFTVWISDNFGNEKMVEVSFQTKS